MNIRISGRFAGAVVGAGALAAASGALAQSSRIDVLPLLSMTSDPAVGAAPRYVGGYTRFYVESTLYESDSTAADRPDRRLYSNEDRGALERWMVGQSISRVVSIRVALSRPEISATTTVAASSHDSSRTRGESWSTEIHGRRMLTPYFRVDATTTATIEANLNASSSIQGDVTGTFIDVLARASRLLAPSTTLVTSLTAPRIDAASDFVDQSISTLFARSLAEKTASQFLPGQWSEGMVTVAARFPANEKVSEDANTEQIGEWKIMVEPAIVSIFNTTPLCLDADTCTAPLIQEQAKEAFTGLAPYTVLNFRLDGQQSLIQIIRGDEAVARALDTLTRTTAPGNTASTRPLAARSLCNAISGKAESLGFNRFDAAAIVWAVTYSDILSNEEVKAMVGENVCLSASLFKELGLSANVALSTTDTPAPGTPAPEASRSTPQTSSNPVEEPVVSTTPNDN